MSRSKHSYIQFYMDDWQGGTAGMTRMIKSVYFDICLYNWDKCKPMTPAHYSLITQDLEHMGPAIIDMLVETGKIEHDAARGYYSPRAMAEGEKAFETWSAKSAGGKKGGRGRSPEVVKKQVTANTVESSASNTAEAIPEAMLEDTRHNQNQNQNHLAAAAAKGGGGEIENDVEEDDEALARIQEAADKSETLRLGAHQIVGTWNIMAATVGLPQVTRMDEKRIEAARALVGEFGADAISDHIRTIPSSKFLTGGGEQGFTAKFDWLMKPENFAGLIEGKYHDERLPVEQPKVERKVKPPIDRADSDDPKVTAFRERLQAYVGDAQYADKFETGAAVVLVDDSLLDLVFRSPSEMAVAQASFEGPMMAAAKAVGRTIRLDYLKPAKKSEDKKHIDTEQKEAEGGASEGKTAGE